MRRSWMERALAALIAVWFVFVTIEPAALHSCPMHGDGHAAAAAATADAEHAHHAGGAHGDGDARQPDDASHHCTCLGDCAGAAPSALPPRAHTPWPSSVAAVSSLPPLEAGFVPPAAEFVRPFANGPPPAVRG